MYCSDPAELKCSFEKKLKKKVEKNYYVMLLMGSCMGPVWSFAVLWGSFWVLLGPLGSFGVIWGSLGVILGSFGSTGGHLEVIWRLFGCHLGIIFLQCFGHVGDHFGPGGHFWM